MGARSSELFAMQEVVLLLLLFAIVILPFFVGVFSLLVFPLRQRPRVEFVAIDSSSLSEEAPKEDSV